MAYGTVNADVIGTSVTGSNLGAGNASIMKNRIINGAMVIDQRNAGASVDVTTANPFTLDRWHAFASQSSKYTVQQNAGSVTPPIGFTNYLGVTSSSAYSVTSTDYFFLNQNIEGFNFADLNWGTANAKTVTLSFWVRSSLTGTFGGSYQNSVSNRSYPFTYTISSANTWTAVSITIAGDTTGTWIGATNGVGLQLSLALGVGSTYSGTAGSWAGTDYRSATGATSVVGTNGATFYITGVQLEVGSSATGFEYRQYGQEMALCQRYCVKYGGDNLYNKVGTFGTAVSTNLVQTVNQFPVQMRTTPSLTSTGSLAVSDTVTATTVTGISITTSESSSLSAMLTINVTSGLTQYRPYVLQTSNSTSSNVIFSAEL